MTSEDSKDHAMTELMYHFRKKKKKRKKNLKLNLKSKKQRDESVPTWAVLARWNCREIIQDENNPTTSAISLYG